MDYRVSPLERRSFVRVMRLGIAFAIVLAIGFIGGLLVATPDTGKLLAHAPFIGNNLDATPAQDANLTDFWEAWNVLNSRFVETHASSTIPDTQKKLWGAIEGLTASYGDPYTVFFPPQQAKVFQQDIAGNFGGVGIELGANADGVLQVIAPLKGTPAALAGILSGDLIIAIDGKSTQGMSTDDAVNVIRGPIGSKVTFTLVRKGQQLTIPVTRATIQVPTIDNSYDAKTGVYTIALYEFTENSGELFDTSWKDFKKSGAHLLIIDLRGDPGGYLDQAVQIAGHFLPAGDVVVTEDYKGKQENIVHKSAGPDDLPPGTKVVVLIDQGSASASEILSGALQDHKVATLVGTRSFGKGSVQELVDIDGGSLKITVARWLTPAGRSISDGGLTADIKVDRTQEDVAAGKDPQKDRAVQFLTTEK